MASGRSLPDPGSGGQDLVRLDAAGDRKSLSRAQKTFNRLTARIEQQRRRLVEWQAFAQSFASRVAEELSPLERRIDDQRRALLKCFDAAHEGGGLTRRQQGRIARIISDQAADLLAVGEDPELIALHDKYSDVSYHDLRQRGIEAMTAMSESMFGMSFDEEMREPDDIIAAIHARTRDASAGDDEGGAGASGIFDEPTAGAQAGPRRAESARARARQAREKLAGEGATRSLREVYRKLASGLHPDRERDPAERARKTALMQRANRAYDARDLLQLLALQIEVAQIDPEHLSAIGDDRLAHYNRVLTEQVAELEREIQDLVAPFAMSRGVRPGREPTPSSITAAFQQDVGDLRRESAWLAQQLEAFRDLRMLKAWLGAQKQGRR